VRFSHPWWLGGSALALAVGALLVLGAWLLVRAAGRFGDEVRVLALITDRPAGRRTVKGVLLVLAVALGFVALAEPQYGRGTRLVPATNLDVVIVLDYSKSMYARDVTPSRIERAKTEVGRLISDLPGARFGAVAFAGEPVSFPLTSDGGAIAQFFRQLSPTDMPVGGTAIGRALESGLDLLRRDPLSTRHRRVIVLVTDGEDLEGDPVTVAESAAKEHVTIHVVQIGGRTPEPIPDIDESGKVAGWRKDSEGQPLTTSLSAAGEEQLTKVAGAAGGNVVRSERGATGITVIAEAMKRMMTEELSERVETVYADVYAYPTSLALLLLFAEASIPEAKKRKPRQRAAEKPKSVATLAATVILTLFFGAGCRDGLFNRHAPAVDDALKALDAGDPAQAASLLQTYLSTGECKGGELGTPDSVRQLPNASLDLGLALFRIAERFGGRLGDDPKAPAATPTPSGGNGVGEDVDCALRLVRIVANDESTPIDLRAKAEYLTGNLEFLRHKYEDAVTAYDAALKLLPAEKGAKEDGTGARAAWNRAIALTRIEDERNKKPDASPPDHPDGGGQQPDAGKKPETPPDAGNPPPKDDKKDDKKNQKKDDKKDGDKKDDKKEKNKPNDKGNEPKPDQKSPQKPPQPSLSQDERMLDTLEQAPTVQQEAAKRNAAHARVNSGMEDK
jgi:Ca-activated chloride channel family protein